MVKCSSADEALSVLKPGMTIFIHGGAATPKDLIHELAVQAERLELVELVHIHLEGDLPYLKSGLRNHFRVSNLFVGKNMREHLDDDRIDYLPVCLRDIPQLFLTRKKPLDAGLFHISPPDLHGNCSLGVSVDIALAAWKSCGIRIAQVNPKMPRVHGDGFVHISEVDKFLEVDNEIPNPPTCAADEDHARIGELVSSLVEDGATLQAGIGAIPNAVMGKLKGHKHLGIHSEMWSDGILELILAGNVDNSQKTVHRGKTVSGFTLGSRQLYDFINDNPRVQQLGIDYVNSPTVIARNPKVTSINSAIEIDLTGQVCADSIGSRIISGVGGQMDFVLGAAFSKGGKSIFAMKSRSPSGLSKIVRELRPGSGVVTTRAQVQFVVTEYGIADLQGKTLSQRAKALVAIAHPEDREILVNKL